MRQVTFTHEGGEMTKWTSEDTRYAREILSWSRTAHYEHNELGADYDDEMRRLLVKAIDVLEGQQAEARAILADWTVNEDFYTDPRKIQIVLQRLGLNNNGKDQ